MSPWDSDKSTAADPDNPAADEQLTADEWDAHVADQKSRVLYGPVADRPAAGDVPNGTVYLITDLANNGGVLTEVVSGAWELKQIGDDANRPDVVGDEGDFNSVDTDEAVVGSTDTATGNRPRLGNERAGLPSALTVIPDDDGGTGSVEVFPSAGVSRSHFLATNNSDPDNFGFVEFEVNGSDAWMHAKQKGTGTAPTQFRFYNFPDGIEFDSDVFLSSGWIRGEQGTPSTPKMVSRFGSGAETTTTQAAATTITGDNSAQDIFNSRKPSLMGLLVVTGESAGGDTFTDLVIQVRNDVVSSVSKVDGNGSPGPRSYGLSGQTVQLTIDDAETDDYNITVNFIGGGQ